MVPPTLPICPDGVPGGFRGGGIGTALHILYAAGSRGGRRGGGSSGLQSGQPPGGMVSGGSLCGPPLLGIWGIIRNVVITSVQAGFNVFCKLHAAHNTCVFNPLILADGTILSDGNES